MSTIIYTSEKVLPYVYYGVHKETGQFYFGSRTAKKNYLLRGRPSNFDFGAYYFTSSLIIKELGFDNFEWTILAEFFEGKDAVAFESECINEFWKHPLSLNFQNNGKHFNRTGKKNSPLHRERVKASRKNIVFSEQHKSNISLGIRNSVILTHEFRSSCSSGEKNGMFGKKHSVETKKKISIKALLREPASEETRQLISKAISGENNGMFGKKHSTETKKHLSTIASLRTGSLSNRSISVTINGIFYGSKGEAMKHLNLSFYQLNKLIENKS